MTVESQRKFMYIKLTKNIWLNIIQTIFDKITLSQVLHNMRQKLYYINQITLGISWSHFRYQLIILGVSWFFKHIHSHHLCSYGIINWYSFSQIQIPQANTNMCFVQLQSDTGRCKYVFCADTNTASRCKYAFVQIQIP